MVSISPRKSPKPPGSGPKCKPPPPPKRLRPWNENAPGSPQSFPISAPVTPWEDWPEVSAGDPGNLADAHDFFVGIGWKIGPGGLFDKQSQSIAEARQAAATLEATRVKAAIGRDVVEATARAKSAHDQISINDEAVAAAEEMVTLAEQRQASQLGVVLEYLLAGEELTRAKQDRVKAVTDFNTAQHELRRALGR